MNQKRQQEEFIFELGRIAAPVFEFCKAPNQFSSNDRSRIRARFESEKKQFRRSVRRFCSETEGHSYSVEYTKVSQMLEPVWSLVRDHITEVNPESLTSGIIDRLRAVTDTISSLPVELESDNYPAKSAFTIYQDLRACFATVKRELVLVDGYLDDSVFYRYLPKVPNHVSITLVTHPRQNEFQSVSKLYANERSSTHFQVIRNASVHDRYLKCDDTIYELGGSIKDAAINKDFRMAISDNVASALESIATLIRNYSRSRLRWAV